MTVYPQATIVSQVGGQEPTLLGGWSCCFPGIGLAGHHSLQS